MKSLTLLLINLSDLDLPIALRKTIRKCTQHPISQFVSYKAFIIALDSITIPNSIHEAFEDRNCIQVIYPKANNQWNVNGFMPLSTKLMGPWRDIRQG